SFPTRRSSDLENRRTREQENRRTGGRHCSVEKEGNKCRTYFLLITRRRAHTHTHTHTSTTHTHIINTHLSTLGMSREPILTIPFDAKITKHLKHRKHRERRY